MEEVYNFLKKCGIFYIATIDGDKPRVRPFGVVNIYEKKLYIQTGKIKNVSKQIQTNPNIEICGYIDNKWLRVEAKAIRDDKKKKKKSMLDANPTLRSMYDEDDANTEVLYLENAKGTFYSFTEEPREVNF